MSFRIHRWFKEGYTGLIRMLIFSALFFAAGSLFAYWTMITFTSIELWGGITSLWMLVMGMTTAICFFIVVEMLGMGGDPSTK